MAVYTPLTDSDVSAHLLRYDLGALISCEGIAEGVENSNFLLVTTQGKFILTVFEKRVNALELPFFTGAMEWLSARDIPCPSPLHGRDGEVIYPLKGKPSCIVSFLQGRGVKTIRNEHLLALGSMTARMHMAGEGCPVARPNDLSLTGWQALAARIQSADSIAAGLSDVIADELAWLESHWPAQLPSGLIHADLFPDNVFFVQETLNPALTGIIDFYFACNDLWMYDVAIAMNAWCFEGSHHEFNITRAGALLKGYNAVRRITPPELETLPVLARGAALRFLLTRSYDWLNPAEGALVKPKNPIEYVKKLRFHQQVKGWGEYGL